jgi:iron complex outermembrane receptor protein
MGFEIKKKSIFIGIIAFCCSAFNLPAQNFIKGLVTDTANTPVPYCAMAILNAKDSSLVKGNVTNETGEFIFENIKAGNYIIKYSNVGFKPALSKPIQVDSLSQISLPAQIMKADSINLKEVSVSVFKPTIEFKKGVVIMNIENNILSSGNTVFELLKRIPGVTIDAQNNISVNGQGGVRFLIDGRLQQIPTSQVINLLMGMMAESVSVIELIKNPPAKYDAAGSGGLINIVLKKAKIKGFSGSLSESNSRGEVWRGGTFLALNYKTNKLTLWTNSNYGWFNNVTNNYFIRKISDAGGTFQVLSSGRQDGFRSMPTISAGAEYEISPKTSIGLNTTIVPCFVEIAENAQANVSGANPFNYDYFKFNINTRQDIITPTANLNVTHKFDSLTQLQFSTDATNYSELSSRFTSSSYFNNANQQTAPSNYFGTTVGKDFTIYTQKLDLTRSFKKSVSLETGFKSSFTQNASKAVVQLTDPATGKLYTDSLFSSDYVYHERILAGYATLGKNFKKIDARAGIRTEHTLIDALNRNNLFMLHRDYINFFPSGSIDYKINTKNSLQVNYSYRLDRPGYEQMNPALTYNDQFSKGSGNPSLKPQYSHNLTADYNYNSFITISGALQQTNGSIYYYSYGDTKSKITIDTVFNYGQRNNASISLFAQKQYKWFNFNWFGMALYRNFRGTINGQDGASETFNFSTNFNLELILPKNFKIQLQGYYNSKFKDGVQVYFPNGTANFTIAKSFLNKKLDISLSLYDAFYTDRNPYTNQVGSQYSFYTERNDTRRIRGYIAWKFGKMKINRNEKHSNDEEKNRLGGGK